MLQFILDIGLNQVIKKNVHPIVTFMITTANISSNSGGHFVGFNAVSNSVGKTSQPQHEQSVSHQCSPVNSNHKQNKNVREDPFACLDNYQEAANIMGKYNSGKASNQY
jgi:hypothetical protein